MDKKEEQQAQQQQMQQQQMDQQKQIADQQAQLQKQIADQKLAFESEQNDLERKKDVIVAQINATRSAKDNDLNQNQIPDALEIGKFNTDYTRMIKELDFKQQDLNQRKEKSNSEANIKKEELRLKEKEIDTKREIEEMKSRTALKNPVSGEKKKK
jgi:hypothetical protein